MYICLLPQNQLLCQQAATITMQLPHLALHIPNLIRIERMYFCLLPIKPAAVSASHYYYNAGRPYRNTRTKFD